MPNLTVPAAGTAQIQVFLASPAALVSGELTIALDPAIFGPIASADVFSVTGDQVGTANIQDRKLDVQFKSGTGGVGRRPDLPVLVISVPVLATAATGATSSIVVKPGTTISAPWRDDQNVTYAATSATATLTVGGSLSIADVFPGGGTLPAGAVVRIDGTGFAAASTVAIDGAAVSSVQFVSPTEIDFTLPGAADLTARRVVVSNPDGAQAAFFPALRGSYVARPTSGALATIQPIFPQQLYPAAEPGSFLFSNAGIAFQNPSQQSVDVIIKSTSESASPTVTGSTVTLPPGGIYVVPGNQVAPGDRAQATVVPTAPIRVAVVDPVNGGSLALAIPVPILQALAFLDGSPMQNFNSYNPLSWNWVAGGAPLSPQTLDIVLVDLPAPFTASAATQSGGSWLSVSPTQGTTCSNSGIPYTLTCPASSKVVLSADPSKLSPGTYNGSLIITPETFGGQATTVPVVLTVSATPQIFVSQTSLDYGPWTPDQTSVPAVVSLTSNADPMPFTVTVVTKSGQDWLSASPLAGNTPATLTLTANPSKLPPPGDTATVTVKGPANAQTVSVSMETATPQPPPIQPVPNSIVFSVGTSQPPPAAQSYGIAALIELSPYTVSAATADGGNWLAASIYNGPGVPGFTVSVNQAGLAAGTYHGTVTISSRQAAGPAQVAVALYVWNVPPPITVSPSALSFTLPASDISAIQTINISTGNIPMYYGGGASTSDGTNWLAFSTPPSSLLFLETPTPATTAVLVGGVLVPGVYHGTVTISAPPGSTNTATVAVTLTVTPGPPPPPPLGTLPLATSVLNAASQAAGAVSPGEIVTIFGQSFGPSTPAGFALGPNGKVATTLGGAEVLFDGIAAPLLYANATQINAIVPYEVAGSRIGNLQLSYNGTPIPVGGIPIADSMPAIFTLDSSGQGAAAVLNQDNSINSAANPAARGSTVQIYATGEGLTTPAGVTGEITGSDTKQPQLPVSVTIGGVTATIAYAASAPNAVSGLFQVNAVVPASIAPGSAVPLLLSVGTARSQANATIAVK